MTQALYTQLDYEQYKDFEEQLKRYSELETTHKSGDLGEEFYHRAFRIRIGEMILEVVGPLVRGYKPA